MSVRLLPEGKVLDITMIKKKSKWCLKYVSHHFFISWKKRLAAVSGYQIRSDPILSLSSLHAIKEIIINAKKGGHVNSLQSICHAGGQYGANVKFKKEPAKLTWQEGSG